jgi:hypothetical protein
MFHLDENNFIRTIDPTVGAHPFCFVPVAGEKSILFEMATCATPRFNTRHNLK